MRVLVVDDYPGAADVACMLLRLLGHETRAATTGADALAKAQELDPDVIVLDLGLPDLSGYDVARELRRRNTRRPFIAAMTGWGATEDRVRSLAAGIHMHVLKPASEASLRKILDAAQQHFSGYGAANPA